MKKRVIAAVICSVAALFMGPAGADASGMKPVNEDPMYESFTYINDYRNGGPRAIPAPAPYRASWIVNAQTLGVPLSEPSDLFVDGEAVYIADRASGAVIVTDLSFKVRRVVKEFTWEGKAQAFSKPEGVCAANGKIYVADTGNKRIVVLDGAYGCLAVIAAPKADVLAADLVFEPQKVTVDDKGRIYAVVKGVYEGIMELYEDGSFGGFVGSIPVEANPVDILWKSIMTKEQRSKRQNFIPVVYTNLDLDGSGFIYTVSVAAAKVNAIRRLNASGDDILMRESLGGVPVSGIVRDEGSGTGNKASGFVDIAAADGIFHALDQEYGRVFTYDQQGNLLFVYGGKNTGQSGTFQKVSAIALLGERVCVADEGTASITVFERTEYASLILDSQRLYDEDRYEDSIASWRQALKYNRNFVLAYSKIGQSLYQLERYGEAMDYFKKSYDQPNYSKAFTRLRADIFNENFTWIAAGFLLAVILLAMLARLVRRRQKEHPPKPGGAADSIRYAFYVLFHPFDGFWDLKHEKRGRIWVSTLFIALTVAAFAIERSLTGFALAANPASRLDWIFELKFVLVPVLLFLVANMSVTTLMDGKGTFRQLYVAVGYALLPLILVKIPLALASNLMTASEAVYIGLFNALAILWVAFLLFGALLSTHEYTGGKTAATIALTGVAVVIICFICVLFFSLFSEIVGFVYTIMEEMRYR